MNFIIYTNCNNKSYSIIFFVTFVLKLNAMSELCKYLQQHRQVGHTTAMINGAMNYDRPFFVLSGTFVSALEISKKSQNKNAIPLGVEQLLQLKGSDLSGNDYPVLIDGFAVTTEIEKINRLHDRRIELMYVEQDSRIKSIEDSYKDLQNFHLSKISTLHKFLAEAQQELKLSKEKAEKLDTRLNKTRKRLKPTLEELSKLSLWDRIFNYKSKVSKVVEDYLY